MNNSSKETVFIYTDGACKGNPGPGGWGVVLCYQGTQKLISGSEGETTNNRMELTAAIKGLQALTKPCSVVLTTDSNYVKDGITKWLPNWKKNDWKTKQRKPVKNKELWMLLEEASVKHQVEWCWVKGHSGHPENELADELAVTAVEKLLQGTQS